MAHHAVLPTDRPSTLHDDAPVEELESLDVGPCRRILVVDDNRDAVETLADLLEIWGHEVWTASEGPTALRTAAVHRPEIVLLDIGLPGMDGYEVARRLRATPGLESACLVALTGYGQPEDRQQALRAGFNHHVTKPLDPDLLAELVRHCALPSHPDEPRAQPE